MQWLYQTDWQELLIPKHSVFEMVVRGTVVYLGLFLILRFLARRQFGQLGIADLLVIVLIADASQNAMAHEYRSVTEGIALVLTIVFWDYALDWLSYRVAFLRGLTEPPPLLLIRNGRPIRANMRSEMISQSELMSQLRQQGIEDLSEVKTAFIESDGRISVIKKDERTASMRRRASRRTGSG